MTTQVTSEALAAEAVPERRRWDPSAVALVSANAIPLFGVLFQGWQVFPILLLYWIENIVVGIFNIPRLVLVLPRSREEWASKPALIPFFCLHYGFFCFCHGAAVFFFFSNQRLSQTDYMFPLILPAIHRYGLETAILAMVLSHGFSLVTNYVRGGEFRNVTLKQVMMQPYRRLIPLHLTIIGAAFAIMLFGSPTYALVLLVIVKMAIDFLAHRAERKRFSTPAVWSPL